MNAFVLPVNITLILFPSCTKTEDPEITLTLNLSQPDFAPILEISEDAEGNLFSNGEKSLFKLYDNGAAEFEYRDEAKKKVGKSSYKVAEITSLKRIRLNNEEIQKFKGLLDPTIFAATQSKYQPKCCCIDTALNYKIVIKSATRKIIDLRNYCDLSGIKNPHIQDSALIPAKVSELMIFIDNIRRKYENR